MKLKDASIARYKEYDEMRRSIAQYLDGVKTETASWQEAEEFDELKKIKFEGKTGAESGTSEAVSGIW